MADTSKSLRLLPRAALRPFPGIVLAASVALLATTVHVVSGHAALSPLFVAMVLGIALRNLTGPSAVVEPGLVISGRQILRFAIILLGFQLTMADVMNLGGRGVALIVLTLLGTFFFTLAIGRLIGVDRKLTELIAAGTSVCGASAVMATNSVTRGTEEDVAYATACVTIFGTIAMLSLPVLGAVAGMDEISYGLWVGATVHEVAQVVAAAFQGGEAAGQAGTVAKLSRVILLAPLILVLGASVRRKSSGTEAARRAPTPWFVIFFIGVVILNSTIQVPEAMRGSVVQATAFLLTMALAAIGLQTDLGRLRAKGMRPLMLGAISSLFISLLGLGLIQCL